MDLTRSPDQVADEAIALIGGGWAWPLTTQSNLGRFFAGLGSGLSDFEAAADSMLGEVDPRTASPLLPDYERVLGADPCGRDALTLTTADRQRLAYQRWTARGGASIAFFVALAASLGVSITITETVLFIAGASHAGDVLACEPEEYVWEVTLATVIVDEFLAGLSTAGDLLGSFAPNLVECVIRRFAPGHTQPVFSYTG